MSSLPASSYPPEERETRDPFVQRSPIGTQETSPPLGKGRVVEDETTASVLPVQCGTGVHTHTHTILPPIPSTLHGGTAHAAFGESINYQQRVITSGAQDLRTAPPVSEARTIEPGTQLVTEVVEIEEKPVAFRDKVRGYAKITRGTVLGKPELKEAGERALERERSERVVETYAGAPHKPTGGSTR